MGREGERSEVFYVGCGEKKIGNNVMLTVQYRKKGLACQCLE